MHTRFIASAYTRAATLFAVLFIAACQTTPPPRLAEPELKLIQTSPLVVPNDCIASGSFVVSYTVATTGRTAAISPPDAPSCIQDALTEWVASFRYEPPAKPTPASMEWMMVTAQRGS
jgi:hypothetical protein